MRFTMRHDPTLFTEAELRRLAGPVRFGRGRALCDMVTDDDEDEYSLWATVSDDQPYLAIVHHRIGQLAGECDCTDSRLESFCEHCVAAGLFYLEWCDRGV